MRGPGSPALAFSQPIITLLSSLQLMMYFAKALPGLGAAVISASGLFGHAVDWEKEVLCHWDKKKGSQDT